MTASSNFGRLTGVVYLAMGLAGFFHLMFVPSRVFVHGDAAATARRLAESAGLFRLGIVAGLLSALGFLFLVLMLHELLAPFGRRLAAVMVILVLVSLPISFVNCFNWMAALILTGDASFLAEDSNVRILTKRPACLSYSTRKIKGRPPCSRSLL